MVTSTSQRYPENSYKYYRHSSSGVHSDDADSDFDEAAKSGGSIQKQRYLTHDGPLPERVFHFVTGHIKKSLVDGFKGLRRHLLPLLFSMAFFMVFAYFNTLCQVLVQNKVLREHREGTKPLIDAGFDYLPNWTSLHNLPDFFVLGVILVTLGKTFLRRRFSCVLLILKRYFLIHGALFALRGISIFITVLPNPWEQCKPEHFDNIFTAPFQIMFGSKRTCADSLYSGHAVVITLCTLVWIQYETNTLIQLIWIPVAILGYMSLIATHFHYSVDVMFASILTLMVWGVYHYSARRLRFLAVQRYKEHGDFQILSPFSEAKPYDAYTTEEKEYLSVLDVDTSDMSTFWKIRLFFHNKHSLPKLLFTRIAIIYFKWFECWKEDLKEEPNEPLLPVNSDHASSSTSQKERNSSPSGIKVVS